MHNNIISKQPSGSGRDLARHESTDLTPLFRAEVMHEQQSHWMGTVLLAPRLSSTLFSLAAVLAAIAILMLLFLGSYARKARIEGWLVPEQGLVRIHVPYPGTVAEIYANEGMMVRKGAALLALSGEVRSEAIGATSESIIKQLIARRDSTAEAKRAQNKIYAAKEADLKQQLTAIGAQLEHISSQVKLQRERLAIGRKSLLREREMQARDLISLTRLQRSEQEHLDQVGRLASLEREKSSLQSQFSQAKTALAELPLLRMNALAELDRSVAALEQELAEAEARRSTIIVAPEDGIVTAILAESGGNVTPAKSLMSLVPADSPLQAQLFGASRAIGFVQAGQRVSLRLQPFPFQRFGSYGGVVTSVSRSPVDPSELPGQLKSQSAPSEPLYRVTVNLDRQNAIAYGKPVALQAGMQVEADVTIETRSLFGWILDPLYTLNGKARS